MFFFSFQSPFECLFFFLIVISTTFKLACAILVFVCIQLYSMFIYKKELQIWNGQKWREKKRTQNTEQKRTESANQRV